MNTAETNTGKAKQDIGCSSPSAEALKLAVLLSGHQHCHRIVHMAATPSHEVCDGCIGDAQTIDRELQLPQRNVALFKAQAVCDEEERNDHLQDVTGVIDELRWALAAIGAKSMNPALDPAWSDLLSGVDALTKPDYHRLNRVAGRNDRLLHAVLCAYAKHHLGIEDIGWNQLGDILHSAICNEIGDDAYCQWSDAIKPDDAN